MMPRQLRVIKIATVQEPTQGGRGKYNAVRGSQASYYTSAPPGLDAMIGDEGNVWFPWKDPDMFGLPS